MRQNMRRVTPKLMAFLFFGIAGVTIALGFQNCAGYEAANNPLYNASEYVCIGLACGENPDLISLSVASDGMFYVRQPTGTTYTAGDCSYTEGYNGDGLCIDVAGYCESGGYSSTEIWAELKGGTVQKPAAKTAATCEDGRFRFLYKLPSGYDYANLHTLRVTIVGVDGNLAQVTNPSGANWHEVGISAYTQL